MKKLFMGLAFAGCLFVHAQEKVKSSSPITFGVKAGFNASTVTSNDSYNYDNNEKLKPGFNAGVFVNIPVAEKFSIQPELLFSQMGSKTEDYLTLSSNDYRYRRTSTYTTNFNYLVLPVMVQYNILPQLYVEAGPEFGLLLGGKSKGDYTVTETSGTKTNIYSESFSNKIPKDLYNKFNFGIGIGAGYYFTQSFGVTARFTAGITSLLKNDISENDNKSRNNAIQVGVAYKFK
ncbi:PorT family protein [Chryseobacterium sp. G0186]|uniref:porin family protein n=1 Tax=Chryseobacterium sp. G0186 TaxID=2487064 RepID=UPI000F50F20E|nr:porin family protein [Chryseobacterium sp. G0186]AZA76521.1 PorT family protein [Chryseobacterium sp. G0186]